LAPGAVARVQPSSTVLQQVVQVDERQETAAAAAATSPMC
jgi:hypothetical protein